MGNRRKPKRPELNLEHDEIHQAVAALRVTGDTDLDAWTDDPPADYDTRTLEWITDKLLNDDQRVNAYHCEACDLVVVTIDKHPGATPMFVSHGMFGVECDGETTSAWYRVRQEWAIYATHEWYRPARGELPYLSTGEREHIAKGGLRLRRIPEDSQTREEALLRLDMPRTNQLRLEVRGRRAGKVRDMEREQALRRLREQAQAAEAHVKRSTGGYRG